MWIFFWVCVCVVTLIRCDIVVFELYWRRFELLVPVPVTWDMEIREIGNAT